VPCHNATIEGHDLGLQCQQLCGYAPRDDPRRADYLQGLELRRRSPLCLPSGPMTRRGVSPTVIALPLITVAAVWWDPETCESDLRVDYSKA